MDPLTHALVGAAAGHAVAGRRLGHTAMAIGALAALAPDLDVLIRNPLDPLLAIQYHRNFTHALAFAPIGGAIAALPWLAFRRLREAWLWLLLAAVAAYASHGLLDASTSFGTLLWWPCSSARVAWHVISILDPLFTAMMAAGTALAASRARVTLSRMLLGLALAYLAVGMVQRERALDAQRRLAVSRGHALERGIVMPTLGNHIVWRSLYSSDGALHLDRLRIPWAGTPGVRRGGSVARYRQEDLPETSELDPRVVRDFARLGWIADGWLARAPDDPSVASDARYSLRTDTFEPVWAVRFHPGARVTSEWLDHSRDRELEAAGLWRELRHGVGYRPLPSAENLSGPSGRGRRPLTATDSARRHPRWSRGSR